MYVFEVAKIPDNARPRYGVKKLPFSFKQSLKKTEKYEEQQIYR